MKISVLREAELESAEAAAWYDDRQLGLGDEFLSEVAERLAGSRAIRNLFRGLKRTAGAMMCVVACCAAFPI